METSRPARPICAVCNCFGHSSGAPSEDCISALKRRQFLARNAVKRLTTKIAQLMGPRTEIIEE